MTVSVAIATYNRAGMVREAIEAALAQSWAPAEIVVSDDASTDATAAVLAEIAAREPRVRVLRQATNSGGVGNWNAAMRATRGELIAWCSDDDRFTPDHLKASIEFLRDHPEIGMVHSSFIDAVELPDFDELGNSEAEASPRGSSRTGASRPLTANTARRLRAISLAARRPRTISLAARPLRGGQPILVNRRNLVGYMIRYYNWPFHPSTIVMRREVWERTGEFDPRYALADTDWFVRAAEWTSIALLPRHGAINRRHAGNWSNRVGSAAMQREIFEIVEGAIAGQRGSSWALARGLWKTVWRANVRARLTLTLWARLRSGHGDAACAAWHGILQHKGRRTPGWIERVGARCIALVRCEKRHLAAGARRFTRIA
jgi:glycosyltransferase involved in cell wall biosynthesis